MNTLASRSGWRSIESPQRVRCLRRNGQVVDLSHCLSCNWLLDLDRAGPPRLRCAADVEVFEPVRRSPRTCTVD